MSYSWPVGSEESKAVYYLKFSIRKVDPSVNEQSHNITPRMIRGLWKLVSANGVVGTGLIRARKFYLYTASRWNEKLFSERILDIAEAYDPDWRNWLKRRTSE